MTWSDFYESMQQSGGMRSGRTSPDPPDILEQNPAYEGKIPPAPVIHRRTSMEWEVFQDEMYKIGKGALLSNIILISREQPPPLPPPRPTTAPNRKTPLLKPRSIY